MALSLFRDCEGLVVLTVQAFASLTPVLPSVFFQNSLGIDGLHVGFPRQETHKP